MKKIKTLLLLLLLLPGISACSTSESDEANLAPDEPAPVAANSSQAAAGPKATEATTTKEGNPAESGARVIREATLRFEVENLQTSIRQVEAGLKQYGAFVFNSRQSNSHEAVTVDYTIKVAPEQLDRLLKDLQRESVQLDVKQVSSRDVTAEYADVAARIRTKQAVEYRYTDLLQKAGKITEILTIEEEIKKVREEREAMQARLNALQQQTSYSTVYLSMYQPLPVVVSTVAEPSFFTDALEAVAGGWDLCRSFILAMLHIWPVWFFGLITYLLFRRFTLYKATQLQNSSDRKV